MFFSWGGTAHLAIHTLDGTGMVSSSGSAFFQWVTDFVGGFDTNAFVRSSGTDILLAGNDALTPLIPRVALLSEQGELHSRFTGTIQP